MYPSDIQAQSRRLKINLNFRKLFNLKISWMHLLHDGERCFGPVGPTHACQPEKDGPSPMPTGHWTEQDWNDFTQPREKCTETLKRRLKPAEEGTKERCPVLLINGKRCGKVTAAERDIRRRDGRMDANEERGRPGEIDKGVFLLLAPKTQSILTFSPVMLASRSMSPLIRAIYCKPAT